LKALREESKAEKAVERNQGLQVFDLKKYVNTGNTFLEAIR